MVISKVYVGYTNSYIYDTGSDLLLDDESGLLATALNVNAVAMNLWAQLMIIFIGKSNI